MFNSEQLQEKWSPLLNHEGLDDIKDPHRKSRNRSLARKPREIP